MKRIVVSIDPDTGAVHVTTEGFAGPACERETADLERALGTTTDNRRTSAFHQAEARTHARR